MLRRSGLQALQALLHLAMASPQWCSVSDIAEAQGLPAPMLEQLLLQLRRAELVEAKRGRQGGYRLSRAAESIPVGEVLSAVGAPLTLNGPGRAAAQNSKCSAAWDDACKPPSTASSNN